MGLIRTVNPTLEPITVEEFKSHGKVDYGTDDSLISEYIRAAREWFEDETHRALNTQTWAWSAESFERVADCRGWIELPRPRLIAVSSIQYIDTEGATQTLAADRYVVDATGDSGGIIAPAYGYCWPSVRCGHPAAVTFTFTAGYGATAADVPQFIKAFIRWMTQHQYSSRNAIVTGTIVNEMPFSMQSIVDRFRVRRFAA